jgi:hypothetical protein
MSGFFRMSQTIRRPIDEVFGTATRLDEFPRRSPRNPWAKKLTPGEVGEGTRHLATTQERHFAGASELCSSPPMLPRRGRFLKLADAPGVLPPRIRPAGLGRRSHCCLDRLKASPSAWTSTSTMPIGKGIYETNRLGA